MQLPDQASQHQMLINGQFVEAHSGQRYTVSSPTHDVRLTSTHWLT